jgi:hypothetical protein
LLVVTGAQELGLKRTHTDDEEVRAVLDHDVRLLVEIRRLLHAGSWDHELRSLAGIRTRHAEAPNRRHPLPIDSQEPVSGLEPLT